MVLKVKGPQSWLVEKFLTHLMSRFMLEKIYISEMCEKRLWKNDILNIDGGNFSACLCQILLFHRYFPYILLVLNQLPGFSISETSAANVLNRKLTEFCLN